MKKKSEEHINNMCIGYAQAKISTYMDDLLKLLCVCVHPCVHACAFVHTCPHVYMLHTYVCVHMYAFMLLYHRCPHGKW